MKKLLSFIVAICVIIVSAPISASAVGICSQYNGDNSEDQNYKTWATPIKSYLSECSDGRLMKVQAGNNISGVSIEYYDTAYRLLESKLVPSELPLFGGFYESDTNYFLLTGQKNTKQLSTTEVYRITKYDKSWNRISSASLSDVNTTIPFDAGSARMVMCDDMLIIHTAHEMYTARDGYNHQSNITIGVDTSAMKVINCSSKVSDTSKGYVSHSFNQFIQLEGKNIVTVDHGDSFPRSAVLIKHAGDASKGEFGSASAVKNIMTFPETAISGDNYTGASIGGFEISSSSYLVAGNTVTFDDNYKNNKTRNIFVTALTGTERKTTYITNYAEGEATASTPHLVKINTDKYMLMWSRENVVYYTTIDANGNKTGSIYSMNGNLSDCVPVVIDNKLVWYTWKNAKNTFYEINLSSITETNSVYVDTGHKFEFVSESKGVSNVKCSNCGATDTISVPTNIKLWWKTSKTADGYYYSILPKELRMKDTLEFMIQYAPVTSSINNEFDVIISDGSILSYEQQSSYSGYVLGKLKLLNIGESTVTFKHKYNPELKATYTINVKTDVTDVKLDKEEINLTTGGSYTLKPTFTPANAKPDCKWRSTNTMVADVDSTGKVTAKGPGTANIYLNVDNTLSVMCTVKVTNVTLNTKKLTLKAGKAETLISTFEPANAKPKYKWVSSDTAVAVVDEKTGEITAKKLGKATIYIAMENDDDIDVDAKCELIVRDVGDINGDGAINSSDPIFILKYCVGLISFSEADKEFADIDGSGEINIVDVLKLQQSLLA